MTVHHTFQDRLRAWIPAAARETWYRVAATIVASLTSVGLLDATAGALWAQLVVGTVTLLFAALYATTPWRVALYALTGPLGGVLMLYSLVSANRWAFIVAAAGQALGITTAAAKTVQRGRHARPD